MHATRLVVARDERAARGLDIRRASACVRARPNPPARRGRPRTRTWTARGARPRPCTPAPGLCAVPARSSAARYIVSFSTKVKGSAMACSVSTGIAMRPVGSASAASSARAAGSAAKRATPALSARSSCVPRYSTPSFENGLRPPSTRFTRSAITSVARASSVGSVRSGTREAARIAASAARCAGVRWGAGRFEPVHSLKRARTSAEESFEPGARPIHGGYCGSPERGRLRQ